jgi:DNA-binding NarL/FixJ family response regulator
VRVVIGEDSVLFREGLSRLLADHGHEIVATAGDALGALDAIRTTRPELAILDVRMPPDLTDDGARAAAVARSEFPELGIVLLSQHVETRHSLDLVARGRFGYLLKDRALDLQDFIAALNRVAAGGSALDPEVVAQLLVAQRPNSPLSLLSPRETEVLALMAEGRTNSGIGARLWLTARTVETHVSSIMGKLRLSAGADDHRRVLAVLAYLDGQKGDAPHRVGNL